MFGNLLELAVPMGIDGKAGLVIPADPLEQVGSALFLGHFHGIVHRRGPLLFSSTGRSRSARALDKRMSAAAVHVEHDGVGVVESRGIGRPAVDIGPPRRSGSLSRHFFSSSVPALNSWSPGPWLGVPATMAIFLRPSASLVRLRRMFLNSTVIGSPACNCSARMPDMARLAGSSSVKSHVTWPFIDCTR